MSDNFNFNYVKDIDSGEETDLKKDFSINNDIASLETVKMNSNRVITDETDDFQMRYNNDDNKFRLQLMEKDKIIFKYSNLLKESERLLDNTKKSISVKDDIISKMKEEQKDLKFKFRNLENILNKREEEFQNYKNDIEDKLVYSMKEKEAIEEKLSELNHIYDDNQSDYRNIYSECKKMEKQIIKLNKILEEKNECIMNYEKMIDEFKKENKNLPLLKKKINDIEQINEELMKEKEEDRNAFEKLYSEKEELENKINYLINENRSEREVSKNYTKANYDLDIKKREIDDKEKEISVLTERYRSLLKENDNFIQLITNELANFSNNLEIVYSSNKPLNLKSIKTSGVNNNNQNSLKYEIVNKNLENLKLKIFEHFNNNLMNRNRIEEDFDELEKQYKIVINEKDHLFKENTINNQKLKELVEKNDDLYNDNDRLNENYNKLKDNYVKMKTEFDTISKNYDMQLTLSEDFINNCFYKFQEIFDKTRSDILECNNYEKILISLGKLIEDYNNTKINHKDQNDQIKKLSILLEKLENERDLYKNRVERLIKIKEDEARQMEENKSDELKKQREILYDKISQLTNLLEESNQMIASYETENKDLKDKIGKLEYHLQMLSKSHMELENSINGNFETLQSEVEEKEYKYNNLLREIELRDIHIQTLEGMLNRKEDEMEKIREVQSKIKSFSDKNFNTSEFAFKSANFGSDDRSLQFSGEFTKSEENERELNRMISQEIRNDAIKIPGKIYSKKNKI